MRRHTIAMRHRSRSALAWGFTLFAMGQAFLVVILAYFHPELRDPESGLRDRYLRKCLAESPARPLVLVLGSSRAAMGLKPSALPPLSLGTEAPPIVFNYSVLGAGPLSELSNLRRLLARGIRPRCILIEVWPPFLAQEGLFVEERRLIAHDLRWSDLHLIRHYFTDHWAGYEQWAEEVLVPCVSYRKRLLKRYAPALAEPEDEHGWRTLDRSGWLASPWAHTSAQEYAKFVENARKMCGPAFERFHISPISDGAMREMLDLCRRNRIVVALFLMPEASELRALYYPDMTGKVDGYLRNLSRAFSVPVIDARLWAPDEDFYDSCHLTAEAAPRFTERFGQHLIRTVLAGEHITESKFDEHSGSTAMLLGIPARIDILIH
jgi:hypothetical protein